MSLSAQFLDELRSRTLLSALIGKSVKLQRAGREYRACCPFHNEKTPSFYVNDEKGFYHCFGCGAHGDAIRWMTEHQNLPFIEAVKELAGIAGLDLPAPDPLAAEKAERAKGLHDVMAAAAAWFEDQYQGIAGAAARAYVEKRGLTAATRKAFGLGYAPDSKGALRRALEQYGDSTLVEAGLLIEVEGKEPYDRFRDRLMIPIRDARGRVIAFGGRIIGQGEPKYLNSPDTPLFDKGRTLYNLDGAAPAARRSGRLIVVEGYLDAIAMSQAGISEVVAPLGTALTEHQIERLWRVTDVPTLCFDGDPAGQKAALRAAERALPKLNSGHSLQIVTLPSGQDPDDLIRQFGVATLEKFLSIPLQLSNFIFGRVKESVGFATPEQRANILQQLRDLSEKIEDKFLAQEYFRTFRELYFNDFGFGRKRLSEMRGAMAEARRSAPRRLEDLVNRAILLGLMRYSDVLVSEVEKVAQLQMENPHLDRWRNILVDAAYEQPELDEDALDTILAASDVSPIEKRDITKDLAFSFFRRGHERARSDLRWVIETCLQERLVRLALAQAEARFRASCTDEDWIEAQRLSMELRSFEQKRNDWAADLDEAA
jgi:DNA primase